MRKKVNIKVWKCFIFICVAQVLLLTFLGDTEKRVLCG